MNEKGEVFVAVGTAADLRLNPRKCSSGFIHIYRLVENSTKLQLLHKVLFQFPFYAILLIQ